MATTEQPTTDRGLDLDTLIGELVALRQSHGNLPVVVWEARQDKYLGIDACWAEDGADGRPTGPTARLDDLGRPVAVVLDAEEGSRPHSTWDWN
jgi:hypothetical protein